MKENSKIKIRDYDSFEKYFETVDIDYKQTLLTIFMNIKDALFPLLEKAINEGKSVEIDESSLPEIYDEIGIDNVILV